MLERSAGYFRLVLRRFGRVPLWLILAVLLLTSSAPPLGDPLERVRFFTRSIEFDFVEWTFSALGIKLEQAVLGTAQYLPAEAAPQTVLEYIDLLRQIHTLEAELEVIYADPAVNDAYTASAVQRQQLEVLLARRQALEPVAETILQNQVNQAAAEAGLTLGGQSLPPALYHTTPPPYALITSPRDVIRQDFNISVSPELSVDEIVSLESRVEQAVDVSALVVGIGGIGLYPTMVMETTDINWLAEVIAHEWIHNYLTLRPLGFSYLASSELRIMNETTASIAGKELGQMVVARYYPDFLPPPPEPAAAAQAAEETSIVPDTPEPPAFDYRLEMRQTRLTVDEMLAAGKIEAAEAYMEQRRQFLWENGYRIRRLNQAYFAFYGAYADEPGGAAGADPVGAAVRLFRQQSPSLRSFVNRISWMVSIEQLQEQVRAAETSPAP